MKPINVLSLFDGLSCCQIALERAGIPVSRYFASEIDKFAIKVTTANYPKTIQIGDVRDVHAAGLWKWLREHQGTNLKIDLLVGGSPCTGFSFAGKGLNFNDPQSKLFFEYVRILNELKKKNPDIKFLLENVRMKKEHEIVISKYLGVEPIRIDSSLISAQTRKRLYWCNFNLKSYGLFGDLKPDIPQPKDKGIFLKDILQDNVLEKYYLSETQLRRIVLESPKINPEKSYALTADNNTTSFGRKRANTLIVINKKGNKKPNQQKAGCLTAGGHSGGNHSDMDLIISMKLGHSPEFEKSNTSGKAYALDTQGKDGVAFHQQDLIQDANGKSRVLVGGTHGSSKHHTKTFIDGTIRRLTEIECERLQTVPDNYTNHVSSTQRYRMLGNGWTVDVIAHILSFYESTKTKIV